MINQPGEQDRAAGSVLFAWLFVLETGAAESHIDHERQWLAQH